VKNNAVGTYNTAYAAMKNGCQRFVLISTDKAVNPTNIMGASKRLCEMIIQSFDRMIRSGRTDLLHPIRMHAEAGDTAPEPDSPAPTTEFVAVRFGNVLGSNGSVIPRFKAQIEKGGPVTVTHPEIIRYFMTIPEASQLVMEAGAMAKRGELFVLDMGKPVKIYDLAVNMIKLSGYEPDVDIMIKEIGLRPGEKLYEELLIKTEELDKTENNMIFIERESPLSRSEVEDKLSILKDAIIETRGEIASPKIKAAMKKVVPTFRDPGAVNSTADKSSEMKMAENNGENK
jgi:FlaA1/EpsC-like NDP-sugar epimerase